MSRNYDNWDRLVAAVLRKELLWRICHEQSRTPSLRSSISSDFSQSASFSFDFANPFIKSVQPLPFQTVACVKTEKIEASRVVRFEESAFAFGLEELLNAPCVVLGEQIRTFTSTYVVSFKGNVIVVKRLTRGEATLEVLNQRLRTIQSIQHENVVLLTGYFFNEDECFGFYDFFHQGSLHTLLHEKKGENEVLLEWEWRVKIAIGAAKGLLHIHRQGSGTFFHGNIKASNIFVNSQNHGCIDINSRFDGISKYHPPEVSVEETLSQASDVYSFGVVLIELVSGRSPLHYTSRRHDSFADWALHNARDEWTTMVVDRALLKYSWAKQGMWDMLGVAFSCLKKKPEERPNMKHVVEMLESL